MTTQVRHLRVVEAAEPWMSKRDLAHTLGFSVRWVEYRVGEGMHFYELRHFCATHLLNLGLAPWEVAVQLGHTDNGKQVMETYGHPSDRAARARILTALDGHDEGDVAAMKQRREGA